MNRDIGMWDFIKYMSLKEAMVGKPPKLMKTLIYMSKTSMN